jgi:NAD dependent epimerase/dehydratase
MPAEKVLVTGAGGFIGSHLTEELVTRGYEVRAFVRYNSLGAAGWLDQLPPQTRKSIDVRFGDIRDANSVRSAVKDRETVLHLAALIAIPYSYYSPESYVDTNVLGTLNVLQAVREFGVSRMVHTSTSEVYGTARSVPIDENHPLQAQSPYSASKIGADQIALSFERSFGTPVAVIRPFNTYGPRQSARAVIPTVITQIASGQRKIRLGNVHPTRDFNFVSDIAQGFIAVAKSESAIGQVINIGTGFEVTIAETAKLIAEAMGASIELETDEVRLRPENSEVDRLCAGNAKALQLTGWKPAFTGREGLSRGLSQTIAWFVKPENLQRYRADIYNI